MGSLVYHPQHEANLLYGVAKGSAIFVKETVFAIGGSITSILGGLRDGVYYLASSSVRGGEQQGEDRDLFDDIEQVHKGGEAEDLNNYSSPFVAIDTQNKIWLKIITREQQNYGVKRRMMKMREGHTTNFVGAIHNQRQIKQLNLKEA